MPTKVNSAVIDAILGIESAGNPDAVNPKSGAEGMAQIMKATQKDPGFGVEPVDDPFDPEKARRFAEQYYGAMLERYGNRNDALRAYNWGPGNVDKWIANGRNPDALPEETREYVKKADKKLGGKGVDEVSPTSLALGMRKEQDSTFDMIKEGILSIFGVRSAHAATMQPLNKEVVLPAKDYVMFRTGNEGTREDLLMMQRNRNERMRQTEVARSLMNREVPLAERVNNARAMLQKPAEPSTPGEVFIDAIMPNATPQMKQTASARMDARLRDQEGNEVIARMLEGEDVNYDGLLYKDRPWIKEFLHEQGISDAITLDKISNINDLIEFVNIKEYPTGIETDWGQLLGTFLERGTIDPQFRASMTAKYGKDWGLRFMAFAAKEVGVDLAILGAAAAFPPAASIMFAGKAASWAARARAVLARAIAVGVGGTSVQWAMDKLMNEDTDLLSEFALRAGASAGIETALGAATVTGKTAYNILKQITQTTAKFAEKHGLKVLTPVIARKEGMTANSVASQVFQATVAGDTKEARALASEVTKALKDVNNPEYKKKLEEIADLTGIKPEDLHMMAGLADKIQMSIGEPKPGAAVSIFGDIGKEGEARKVISTFNKIGTEAAEKSIQREKLAAAVEELQKKFAKRQPKTEAGIAAREAKMKALTDPLEALDEEIKVLRASQESMRPQFEWASNARTSTGSSMTDAMVLNNAIGYRVMGELTERQRDFQDVMFTYINRNEFQFRDPSAPVDLNWVQRVRKTVRLEEPDYTFGNVAKDMQDALHLSVTTAKRLEEGLRIATQGMNTKSQQRVWTAIAKGADEGKLYTPRELDKFNLTPDQKDSYYTIRKVLDVAHTLQDAALIREANKKGIKSFKGTNVMVDGTVDGEILTKNAADQGYVKVRPISKTLSEHLEWQVVNKSQLEDVTSMLPYEPGYVPIVYKDARFHISLLDFQEGTISRTMAFKTAKEAREAWEKLRSDPNLPKHIKPIWNEWNDIGQIGRVGIADDTLSAIDVVDQKVLDNIKENYITYLKEQGATDEEAALRASKLIENFKFSMDKVDFMSMRRPFVGDRAPTRLKSTIEGVTKNQQIVGKTAEMKPAEQAVVDYLQSVARKVGFGSDWRNFAIDQFKKRYAKVIDKTRHWTESEFILNTRSLPAEKTSGNPAELRAQRAMAIREQQWLIRTLSQRSWLEQRIDDFVRGQEMKWAVGKRPVDKVMAKFWNTMPLASEAVNALRGISAQTKLGFFNPAQIIVQGAQAANIVGAHPVYATGGAADLFKASAAWAKVKLNPSLEKSLGKETRQALFAARRAGYLTDIDTSDMMHFMEGNWGVVASTLNRTSMGPFIAGEAFNRSMAFFTVRREAMDLARQGKLVGLDGKPFKGRIDDDEFLRIVTNKAKLFALNMGRAGQLELFSGTGSLWGQFKQVAFKQMNMFTTKELSFGEKMGAAAALVGLFGGPGIIFSTDLMTAADWGVFKATGSEPQNRQLVTDLARNSFHDMLTYIRDAEPGMMEAAGLDVKTIEKFAKKGSIYVASDGDVDLTQRLALGKFFTDMFEAHSDNWVENVADLVVFTSVMHDIFDAMNKTGTTNILMANPYTYVDLLSSANNIEEFNKKFKEYFVDVNPQSMLRTAKEYGQAISMLGHWARIFENTYREEVDPNFRALDPSELKLAKSATGRTLPVEVTPGQNIQAILGLTHGDIAKVYEIEDVEFMYRDAWKNYLNGQKEAYASGSSVDKTRIMRETVENAYKVMHILADKGVRMNTEDLPSKAVKELMKFNLRRNVPKGIPNRDG